ncbi:TrkA C-terminal domain-containing protein, partial [Calditrichota bacterium]
TIQGFISQMGEKASEATAAVKLKLEVNSMQKVFDDESLHLGNLLLKKYRKGKFDSNSADFLDHFNKMLEIDQKIKSLKQKYDDLRKELSSDYVVSKLSKDLETSGAIIEQAVVSKESNVIDKMLKEILLPKQALVSAIKRGDEMIIPDGNTKILAGDQVTIIGKTEDVEKVYKRFTSA